MRVNDLIGRTAKSVTELLNFLRAIYGGGFLPIPTDSYSDVTFSYKSSGTWLPANNLNILTLLLYSILALN